MNPSLNIVVEIDGTETNVLAQVIDQKFWFRIGNQTFCYDLAELQMGSSARKNKSLSKSPHLIVAPMPGKITKIFVAAADKIEKAQPLLVMEAMKMEYTLKAEIKTKVDKINVKVGDQVVLGHLLLELFPEAIS